MRKPLYNIVIFIFHIITLILLFTLCIHFNVIKLDLLDFSKEAVASFFKNDYVVNIVCTILTAAALYIVKAKLFCPEIAGLFCRIAGLFCHDSRANLSLKPVCFGIAIS